MWKIVGNFGRDNNIQGLRQLTLNPHFRNAMNNDILNNFPNLETRMSTVAYNYLQQILNSMPNTLTPTCFTIPSRIDSAITICVVSSKNIENNIMNDTNLIAEEKVSLLCAASVARHSYTYWSSVWGDYWSSVWGDVNDKWWEILNEIPQPNPNDVLTIVHADVAGAIVGGVWSYATGGDVVIGAVGGAISGSTGVVGRLANLLKKIF
jgi:hypothetical protein